MIPDINEDYEVDLFHEQRFRNLSIQQIIDLVYFLNPLDSDQDLSISLIISDFLLHDFNTFEEYACYFPSAWNNISLFALNLLLKRAIQNSNHYE